MDREAGSKAYPIWLIADSSPPRWEEHLRQPLDPRHPARHNIWTPILEGIQSHVFQAARTRIDTTDLYVRNAVHDVADKPPYRRLDWPSRLAVETRDLASLVARHRPKLLLTFGAFACEFARRSLDRGLPRAISHWTSTELGNEFRRNVGNLDPAHPQPQHLPLLHVSIARGTFSKEPLQVHGGRTMPTTSTMPPAKSRRSCWHIGTSLPSGCSRHAPCSQPPVRPPRPTPAPHHDNRSTDFIARRIEP